MFIYIFLSAEFIVKWHSGEMKPRPQTTELPDWLVRTPLPTNSAAAASTSLPQLQLKTPIRKTRLETNAHYSGSNSTPDRLFFGKCQNSLLYYMWYMSFSATCGSGKVCFFIMYARFLAAAPKMHAGASWKEKTGLKRHVCDTLVPVISEKVEIFSTWVTYEIIYKQFPECSLKPASTPPWSFSLLRNAA